MVERDDPLPINVTFSVGIVILIVGHFRGRRGNDPQRSTRKEKLNRLLLLIPLPLCFRTAQGIVSGAAADASGCGSPRSFFRQIRLPFTICRGGRKEGDRKVLSREKEPGSGKMTPAIADHGYSRVEKER